MPRVKRGWRQTLVAPSHGRWLRSDTWPHAGGATTGWHRAAQVVYRAVAVLCLAGLGGLLQGCDERREAVSGPTYAWRTQVDMRPLLRLAVHPLHNPAHLLHTYQPLIEHLSRQLPAYRFELEASRDYASYERKIEAQLPELLLPNPLQTLTAIRQGYTVVAMAGDADEFRGVVLVPKSSGVQRVQDLKGKRVSFPAPTALAATIMPQRLMRSQGIDPARDIQRLYVGSQESSMMAAIQGESEAASTWLQPWRDFQSDHPALAERLRVLVITPPLVNNAVMVRNDLPAALRDELAQVLVSMHLSAGNSPALGAARIRRFHPANNATYDVVAQYLGQSDLPDGLPITASP